MSSLSKTAALCVSGLMVIAIAAGIPAAEPGQQAKDMIAAAGATGGLVVHVGCGGGKLTAALRTGDACIVHGLDADPADVRAARSAITAAGRYGPVTVDLLAGDRLPYVDNLVKLAIVENTDIPRNEIIRVLAPRGTALVKRSDGKWEKVTKPWPAAIDEWTHYLHDATNNAVAEDTRVGPPSYLQWTGGPEWTRNHHKLNSLSAAVTAAGRLFYIFDEATAANMRVPGKWSIVCRDAFSGVLLWKKPLASWGAVRKIRFRSGPPQLPRLLVAQDNRLYLPLGLGKPVSELDAATGKTLRTFAETDDTEEIILAGDTLLVLRGTPVAEHAYKHPAHKKQYTHPNAKIVTAVDLNTGKTAWESDPVPNIQPLTLAAGDGKVYYQAGEGVICRGLDRGKQLWTYGKTGAKRGGKKISFGTHTLVVSGGVVLCNLAGSVHAIAAETGKPLWQQKASRAGFHEPLDIFVIDGLVWMGTGRPDSGRRPAPPNVDDFNRALDLHTGAVERKSTIIAELQTVGHHHRCYREKATTRYIITGKRGVEMMDLKGDNHSRNNWVRGSCQYGNLFANGLVYGLPHSCGCYMESKVRGFWAMAAKRDTPPPTPDDERLVKGAAFGKIDISVDPPAGSWPTYRHDPLRSGVAGTALPAQLKTSWTTTIGGILTQPVVAGDKAIVSAVDRHTIYALDEKTGETAWTFPCGGRVDTPPTVCGTAVIFGCADGRVYCLRLSDGETAWTFDAAPAMLHCGGEGRVESVWPVHGSVLVLDGVVYCAAGRSTWLDGGIHLYGLDPVTGTIRYKNRFHTPHPTFGAGKDKAGKKYQKKFSQTSTDYKTFLQSDHSDSFSMAGGGISDVLVSDGRNVFLHQAMFDRALKRQEGQSRHLFSTSSLLDDAENHRSHWVLGTGDFSMVPVAYSWIVNSGGGRRGNFGIAVPYGIIFVYDETGVWGVHRGGGANGRYVMFRRTNKPFTPDENDPPDFRKLEKKQQPYPYAWKQNLSIRPRAVLKAGQHVFLANTPTTIPDDDPHAAYEGRLGGMIAVYNAKNGKKIAEHALDAPVVWDGMAAARGRLYAATTAGTLLRFEKE